MGKFIVTYILIGFVLTSFALDDKMRAYEPLPPVSTIAITVLVWPIAVFTVLIGNINPEPYELPSDKKHEKSCYQVDV